MMVLSLSLLSRSDWRRGTLPYVSPSNLIVIYQVTMHCAVQRITLLDGSNQYNDDIRYATDTAWNALIVISKTFLMIIYNIYLLNTVVEGYHSKMGHSYKATY